MGALQKARIAREISEMVSDLAPHEREKFAIDLQKMNVNSLRWIREHFDEQKEIVDRAESRKNEYRDKYLKLQEKLSETFRVEA